jgi:hypothetical protein
MGERWSEDFRVDVSDIADDGGGGMFIDDDGTYTVDPHSGYVSYGVRI